VLIILTQRATDRNLQCLTHQLKLSVALLTTMNESLEVHKTISKIVSQMESNKNIRVHSQVVVMSVI